MHPAGGQAAATACQPNKALESLDIPLRASSLRYWWVVSQFDSGGIMRL